MGPQDNTLGIDLLNLQLGLVDRDFDESDYEVGTSHLPGEICPRPSSCENSCAHQNDLVVDVYKVEAPHVLADAVGAGPQWRRAAAPSL